MSMNRAFERVVELDPGNVSALNTLAAMHWEAGDVKTTETYLVRAVRRDTHNPSVRYNLGLLFDKQGDHAAALREWEKAAVDSDKAWAASQWGSCLAQQGRIREAMEWFRRAIERQPTFLPARRELALALSMSGDAAAAVNQLHHALKIDPDDQLALALLRKVEKQCGAAPRQ